MRYVINFYLLTLAYLRGPPVIFWRLNGVSKLAQGPKRLTKRLTEARTMCHYQICKIDTRTVHVSQSMDDI